MYPLLHLQGFTFKLHALYLNSHRFLRTNPAVPLHAATWMLPTAHLHVWWRQTQHTRPPGHLEWRGNLKKRQGAPSLHQIA